MPTVPVPVQAAKSSRTRSAGIAPLRLADAALIVAFLALTFLLGVFPLKDVDFWWHLRTGDLIRATGEFPHKDIYTYTVPDRDWTDLHWGFQVALSWGYERGGVVFLNLAKCVVTCLAISLLITARRREWPLWVMLPAWLPALILLGGRMYIRPETLTLLWLSAFLAILFRWDRYPKLAFLLPLIQVGWVNTQGLFVLGPIVLSFALIDAALRPGAFDKKQRGWWKIALTATVLTGFACLFNPYGIEGALFPLTLFFGTMADPVFKESIAELSSISKLIEDTAGYPLFMLQVHLTVVTLGALSFLVPLLWRMGVSLRPLKATEAVAEPKSKKGKKKQAGGSNRSKTQAAVEPYWRLSPFRLLLFAAFTALSWQATRNSHQFAAVAGAVTAWNFGEWAAALARRRAERKGADAVAPRLWPRLVALGAIGLMLGFVGSGQLYAKAEEGRTIGLGEEPAWFPHKAVAFAAQEALPPRFVSFHIGHAALYLYQHGPERKVFADPRLEVMGAEQYQKYLDLQRAITIANPGWTRELDEAGRPVVLVDHTHNTAVGASMFTTRDWPCIWFDEVAAVFAHESDVARAGLAPVDFQGRHFGAQPYDQPRGAIEWRASARAIGRYALQFLQAKGRPSLALVMIPLGLDHARKARELEPRSAEAWGASVVLEVARDPLMSGEPVARYRLPFDPLFDLHAARATYFGHKALDLDPDDSLILTSLAGVYQIRRMDEPTLPILEHLLARPPRTANQAVSRRGFELQRAELRSRLGPMPRLRLENGSQVRRTIEELLASGRVETAAQVLDEQYPEGERDWTTADRLATLRMHLGQPELARAAWLSVSDPPRPGLQAARVAATYYVEDDFDTARDAYHEAIRREPDLFEAQYGLALLEHDAGNASSAFDAATRALEVAPTNVAREGARKILNVVARFVQDRNTSPLP